MHCLAVFDFDKTVVDADSDQTIIQKVRERNPPPERKASNYDWTPYMSNVFEHAFTVGFQQDDILSAIASMKPTVGMTTLLQTLSDEGWDVLLLTDANSVFVHHWLKTHGLEDAVTSVITNRAFWQHGRLFIEPCMSQTACKRCPSNLCKSLALAQYCSQNGPYDRVVYTGDGQNDFCPASSLPEHVFEHAFTVGFQQDDILSAIASMKPTVGMTTLLQTLSDEGWDVLLLTDANSVFVHHWLKTHGLEDAVTSVITNRAFWQHGRLFIEPCMSQTACKRCPSNLCKSLALAQYCSQNGPYDRVVYTGDGQNDFCPASSLPEHCTVFPRRGYSLDKIIKKTMATQTPQIKAKVVPWDDCYKILKELFPSKANSIKIV